VIFEVGLRRFRCVVRCVMVMTVRQPCVVCGGLVFACFVVSGRFFVLRVHNVLSLYDDTLLPALT